jgi:tRNA dimethylallyltransferase
MKNVFFVVGPTATGKSEIAGDVAVELSGEIVNADAFQIYRGFDLLTAKPDKAILAQVPHHLVSAIALSEEMNAEKFRHLALNAIAQTHSRRKLPIVVGGSGLYLKALTHGLTKLPQSDPNVRTELNELNLEQLRAKLLELDPAAAQRVDIKNRRRIVRAIEIRLLSGKPVSARTVSVVAAVADRGPGPTAPATAQGVFVFRDRDELYRRINRRVEHIFERGVVEEVRAIVTSAASPARTTTASQMIGLAEIRQLLDGEISRSQCITAIQQATRRYAKRQLTWFRHQTSFESLNLSLLTRPEAVKWISQKARLAAALGND